MNAIVKVIKKKVDDESSKSTSSSSKSVENLTLVGVADPLQLVLVPTTLPSARPNGVMIHEFVYTTYSGLSIKHVLSVSEGKGK